ncbi:hypothetical protein [Pseudomonas sp. PIC25]|uniref:hypothetical protein n=1 Tax=Pseudomonas sp. PIC25 TaxID=1958773 RepID=UPI00117AFA46|nr:hypothetical protein [Pseudomonas sp. PIC25]
MSKRSKIIIFVLVFLASFACLIFVYGDRVIVSFYGGGLVFNGSTAMDLHKASVGGGRYCIPKAYYRFSNSFYSGSSIGVNLSLDVDGFMPWNIYREKYIGSDGGIKLDKEIGVVLYSDASSSGREEFWRLRIPNPRVEKVEGYTKLWPTGVSQSELEYFLIPDGVDDYSVLIRCWKGRRCELDSLYKNSVRYKLNFDERYLVGLEELNSRVISFIDSLRCD